MSGLDVDTRTDVYSLGVILNELLIGALPFETEKLRSAGFGEIQRIISETEPPKASTRLNSLKDTHSKIADQKGTDPASPSAAGNWPICTETKAGQPPPSAPASDSPPFQGPGIEKPRIGTTEKKLDKPSEILILNTSRFEEAGLPQRAEKTVLPVSQRNSNF